MPLRPRGYCRPAKLGSPGYIDEREGGPAVGNAQKWAASGDGIDPEPQYIPTP
jgi:hypothetical protein